jgi:hypothetical protein
MIIYFSLFVNTEKFTFKGGINDQSNRISSQ